MTVGVLTSLHGMAKGKRENSSVAVKRYLFTVADGNGPLKSILTRSKGCVTFTSFFSGGLINHGLHSVHVLHDNKASWTSSTDTGMFFVFR